MNIESAGARLKKIRLEKNLTLEDVQKKTKIHLNVLRAVEGDSLTDLSPIYLKSFIKIYCNFLGVDPKEYTGAAPDAQKPALNATIGRDIGARVEKKQVLKEATVKLGALKPPANLKKIIIGLIGALLVIFLAVNLVKFISSRSHRPPVRAKVLIPNPPAPVVSRPETVKSVKAKAAVKKAVPVAVKANTQKDIAQGFVLGVFARDKSWISAKVDGKVVFFGELQRGRSEIWSAKDKIELSIGDAGAVELQVNDQRFVKLGRRGQSLKNIIINKEGLKFSR